MKKIHLVGLILIAAAIISLISAAKDFSEYASFASASSSDKTVKIVGTLCKDKMINYDPRKDPNYLSFYVKDKSGEIREVILKGPKPTDFERSEQIVLTGKMNDKQFVASDMLLKCPSKYKDEEIYVKSVS